MRYAALPLAALLALSACGGGAKDEGEQTAAPAATDDAGVVLQLPPEKDGDERPAPEPVRVEMTMPDAVQGRWGLTAADCDPARQDAKGLLVVTPTQLEFYESVGDLSDISEIEDHRIRGTFGFTGEGMSWKRDVVLDAQDGGKVLVRREYGDEAAPGPFRYTRCK